jgi:hypothetical protein
VNASKRLGLVVIPVLFAVFPLLSLFAQNQTEVELRMLWWPAALSVFAGLGAFGLTLLAYRDAAKAAVLASLLAIAFFYYGAVAGWGPAGWWYVVLCAAILVVVAVALVRTTRDVWSVTVVLAVAAVVVCAGPAIRIVNYEIRHPLLSATDPRIWPHRLAGPTAQAGSRPPDIYVLVPDDYARPDVLRRYFHYTDTRFLDALRRRGFTVAPDARSPYSDSESNIAAEMNMDYLTGLPKILGPKSQDVRPLRRLIADNRAARLLEPLGYRYLHLDTDEVTFPTGNPDISSAAVPDSLENLWLQKTVLRVFGGPIGFDPSATDRRFRESVHTGFSRLHEVTKESGPKFVLFHTLLPHDPYVFGLRGQPVDFPYASDAALGSKLGMPYYLQQLEHVHHELLRAVDAIRANSARPPVIVIVSDEGFQAENQFGERAMQLIRVKGLVALSLPGVSQPRVPGPPNTVNVLRYVFNQVLGTHYPTLPSHSYPEGDYPYQYEEMRVR